MNRLLRTARGAWPVLLSYGLFSLWGMGSLLLSVGLSKGSGKFSDLGSASLLLLGMVVGHLGGNVLGLLGLRMLPVVVVFGAAGIVTTLAGLTSGMLGAILLMAAIAAFGGYLGVASRLDVFAAWYPLSLASMGAVNWLNQHGVGALSGSAKYAIWDTFTLLCMAGSVFFMLVFLATRNSLALTAWQQITRPSSAASVAVARPGRGSVVVLFVCAAFVLGATAILSPYLFRTHAVDDEGRGDSDGDGDDPKQDTKGSGSDEQSGQGNGKSSEGKGSGESKKDREKPGKGNGGGGKSGEGNGSGKTEKGDNDSDESDSSADSPSPPSNQDVTREAFQIGTKLLLWLLVALLLLVVLGAALLPPLRRSFLLRHLERPQWPVAPTVRVMNLWRWALAHLAVLDVVPETGETPSQFAHRVSFELDAQLHGEAAGLCEAAAIVERVDYAGRGLGRDDEARMRAAVTRTVVALKPLIPFKKWAAAAWGAAPQVD